MKASETKSFLILLMITALPIIGFNQKLVENHFEAVEQFSRVQSKSKSMASYAKRNLAKSAALDSAELMYMELKESSDAAISRYKSIIDNPSLAKKTEATITANLNEMNEDLVKFVGFISAHAKKNTDYQQIIPVALLTTFTGLGTSLIKEINSMKNDKKLAAKKELDQFVLSDWVAIE